MPSTQSRLELQRSPGRDGGLHTGGSNPWLHTRPQAQSLSSMHAAPRGPGASALGFPLLVHAHEPRKTRLVAAAAQSHGLRADHAARARAGAGGRAARSVRLVLCALDAAHALSIELSRATCRLVLYGEVDLQSAGVWRVGERLSAGARNDLTSGKPGEGRLCTARSRAAACTIQNFAVTKLKDSRSMRTVPVARPASGVPSVGQSALPVIRTRESFSSWFSLMTMSQDAVQKLSAAASPARR